MNNLTKEEWEIEFYRYFKEQCPDITNDIIEDEL